MRKVFALLLLVAVFFSCKKENEMERNLWENGGEWSIVSYVEKNTSSAYPYNEYVITHLDYGIITFKKGGTGTILLYNDMYSFPEPLAYDYTETTLTLYDADGSGTVFDLDWQMNKLTLTLSNPGSFTTTDPNGEEITVNTISETIIKCEKI